MHAWRTYMAVLLPLATLLWGQLQFANARESLHIDVRHELTSLERSLARDVDPDHQRTAMLHAASRIQARSERFADEAFHLQLYFGLFPLTLGLSLLAAEQLRAGRTSGR